MERLRRLQPIAVLLLAIGAAGLSHFSANVRNVDAIGLAGAGFALGVGFTLLVQALKSRLGS